MGPVTRVSVVIPTYNRLPRLRRVIAALEHQTFPTAQFEVIVVSDGSTDGTDRVLEQLQTPLDLVVSTQRNQGPAAARNEGVRLATGDLLLFLDDDVIPGPRLVEQHAGAHRRHDADIVVIGPMLTPSDHRLSAPVRWEQAMLYKQYDALRDGVFEPTYRQFYTGNASLRPALLARAGGFNERFRRAEDIELAYRLARAGAQFFFDEEAVGFHYAERTFRSWLRNAREYGRNDVAFARECGQAGLLLDLRFEFSQRHTLIRGMTWASCSSAWVRVLLEFPVRCFAASANAVGIEPASRTALSALYNIAYYGGVADALGGRAAFTEVFDPRRSPVTAVI